MTTSSTDFGRCAEDYATHRPGFPAAFYDRLDRFVPLRGAAGADLGTGPGVVALELARRGARVVGVDVSPAQIAHAARLAAAAGLGDRADFRVARAEETGLPAESFDLATAGQCWRWFDQDAVFAEVKRILRPHGLLVIAQYCYLPGRSEVARDTERLILEHNPGWALAGNDGLYPWQVDAVVRGGLDLVEQFCFDHEELFSHERWRGRMRTCNGVGSGPMSDEEVRAFDAELAALLRRSHPREPLRVWHRVRAVAARRPAPAGRPIR